LDLIGKTNSPGWKSSYVLSLEDIARNSSTLNVCKYSVINTAYRFLDKYVGRCSSKYKENSFKNKYDFVYDLFLKRMNKNLVELNKNNSHSSLTLVSAPSDAISLLKEYASQNWGYIDPSSINISSAGSSSNFK
jgi:hypothetical protein